MWVVACFTLPSLGDGGEDSRLLHSHIKRHGEMQGHPFQCGGAGFAELRLDLHVLAWVKLAAARDAKAHIERGACGKRSTRLGRQKEGEEGEEEDGARDTHG